VCISVECTHSAFKNSVPYYCTPPVCVLDVIGALAVWRQIKTKKMRECRSIQSGAFGLPSYCTPPVNVPDVIGAQAVWPGGITNQKKSMHHVAADLALRGMPFLTRGSGRVPHPLSGVVIISIGPRRNKMKDLRIFANGNPSGS